MSKNTWTKKKLEKACEALTSGKFASTKEAIAALREEFNWYVSERAFRRATIKAIGKRPNELIKLPSHPLPEGHHIRGVSTLVNKDGQTVLQWFKTAKDRGNRTDILEETLAKIPKIVKVAPPAKKITTLKRSKDILSVYPIGDLHFGMKSSIFNSHENFDIELAQKRVSTAIAHLVKQGHPSREAWILNVGDLAHADDDSNATPTNKNPLDVDGQWAEYYILLVHLLVWMIEEALKYHDFVHLTNEIGNHDPRSAFTLAVALHHRYVKNNRVKIDVNDAHFHFKQHGNCFFMSHHGHGKNPAKAQDLAEIMAGYRPKEWGTSKYRYIYTGHVHMQQRFDRIGCEVESFRPAASRGDKWHASLGYMSKPQLMKIQHSSRTGELGRYTVNADMVDEILREQSSS
jgi:hypothetical protein